MFENRQITQHLLMVRPAHFAFNVQTAASNAFQQSDENADPVEISRRAVAEFDTFVSKLRTAGVNVLVAQDSDAPAKPDAIFPNNWLSTHSDLGRGACFLYPMFAQSRQLERDPAILELLSQSFKKYRQFDFSQNEQKQRIVEGTGSMILDRVNGIIYACASPRTDGVLLDQIAAQMGFSTCLFNASDAVDQAIYHTNVMMALGETCCVICLESIKNPEECSRVVALLEDTDKEIIDISLAQMNQFAGNMLQVLGENGPLMVMSQSAYNSLTHKQLAQLETHTQVLSADLTTIEIFGGGSARCMLAEIFLPLR